MYNLRDMVAAILKLDHGLARRTTLPAFCLAELEHWCIHRFVASPVMVGMLALRARPEVAFGTLHSVALVLLVGLLGRNESTTVRFVAIGTIFGSVLDGLHIELEVEFGIQE